MGTMTYTCCLFVFTLRTPGLFTHMAASKHVTTQGSLLSRRGGMGGGTAGIRVGLGGGTAGIRVGLGGRYSRNKGWSRGAAQPE